MNSKKYYEGDIEGNKILNSMSKASKLNFYFFEQLKPYLGNKNLEIGSGIGNISCFFFEQEIPIDLSEINPDYHKELEKKFKVSKIINVDLNNINYEVDYKALKNKYDLVYAFNVVEHIEDDRLALKIITYITKPSGYIFILVPSYQVLYNNFDKILDHFRRYNTRSLDKIFPSNTKTIKSYYLNFIGIFAWFLFGSVLNKKTINEGNMKLYNFLMPIIKFFDLIVFHKIGLSSIVIKQKK